MNRTDRLVAMVMVLQGRRVVRAEELAQHFEVSVRTIYRDLDALGEAGVPIAGEAGVGYTLVRGYHLPPVMLTGDEASALFLGAELVRGWTDASVAEPAAAALMKIRSVLPRERQDELDRLAETTAISAPGCGGRVVPEQRWLRPIQQALVTRRVLRLRYRARDGRETERQIEPLGAAFFGGSWYVVGWCRLRDDVRHFKVERILELTLGAERCGPREGFSLRAHLATMEQRPDAAAIRLRVQGSALDRVRREAGRVEREIPRADGVIEVVMRSSTVDWVPRWVLSFAGQVELLEPAGLREEVRRIAARLVEAHAGTEDEGAATGGGSEAGEAAERWLVGAGERS